MFEATAPALFLDYFRVPYVRAPPPAPGFGAVSHVEGGRRTRSLLWPTREALAVRGIAARVSVLGSIMLFAPVLPDDAAIAWLGAVGGRWEQRMALLDGRGRRVGSIWQEVENGSVFLPFDPAEAIEAYWSEGYKRVTAAASTRAKSFAMAAYYRLRPATPRAAQIALRRAASHVQARARFPRWPLESTLHDLYDLLFGLLGEIAREPVPWIAPWPNGYSWALVLTHDVETQVGYQHLEAVREIERAAGRCSSWNFVPGRYAVEDGVVRRLTEDGCEVGVHGLYHDGRDTLPAFVTERLPAIRAAAERWSATGFRAPATRRVWDVMPQLGFDYDSSYPDTDPFEPDGGGCCTWLPFFNRDTVELPITLVQDYTLFTILRRRDESLWLEKARELRARGGLALLITHPDYMLGEPQRAAYRRFLQAFADDEHVWSPLPHELAAWWRRRAALRLERIGGHWTAVGAGAELARVAYAPGYPSAT